MNLKKEYCKLNGYTKFNKYNENNYTKFLEKKITELNQALQLQQTGVSTCFLEDYEDHFFEVKYKQVSCCKIAPITNENYCPNCGKKILK